MILRSLEGTYLGFSPNLLCALTLWRSGLGLQFGKFRQLLTKLSIRPSVVHPSVVSFSDDNLSEYQWIFTKLGMCIDIVEICLGLQMDKFRRFSSYLPTTRYRLTFRIDCLQSSQNIHTPKFS